MKLTIQVWIYLKSTMSDPELLSLHAVQRDESKNEKTAYSVVQYLSNKRATSTVSEIEVEIKLVL